VGAGPQDFERMKLIGQGDVGKVYLVRLQESTNYFAIKALLVPKGN
jgi:protein-serine/threonine kinase